jgi:hypothetical protein
MPVEKKIGKMTLGYLSLWSHDFWFNVKSALLQKRKKTFRLMRNFGVKLKEMLGDNFVMFRSVHKLTNMQDKDKEKLSDTFGPM